MKNVSTLFMIFSTAILKAKIDYNNKKLTMKERLISFLCAVLIGGAAGIAVASSDISQYRFSIFIVPAVTLLGESVGTWIYGHVDPIMTALLEKFKNNKNN